MNDCGVCGGDVKYGKCLHCGQDQSKLKVGGRRKGRSSKKDKFANKEKRERMW